MYAVAEEAGSASRRDEHLLRPRIYARQRPFRADRRPDQFGIEGTRRQDRGSCAPTTSRHCRRRSARNCRPIRSCAGTIRRSASISAWKRPRTPRCSPRSASARTISEPGGIVEAMTSSAEIIATLGLKPHPEGGWYAETFRDGAGGARGHSTAIYFLLEQRPAFGTGIGSGTPPRSGITMPARRWRCRCADEGSAVDRAGARHRISPRANGRRSSCRPAGGNRRAAWATGRWSAAPSRRALISPPSNWPQPGWNPTPAGNPA